MMTRIEGQAEKSTHRTYASRQQRNDRRERLENRESAWVRAPWRHVTYTMTSCSWLDLQCRPMRPWRTSPGARRPGGRWSSVDWASLWLAVTVWQERVIQRLNCCCKRTEWTVWQEHTIRLRNFSKCSTRALNTKKILNFNSALNELIANSNFPCLFFFTCLWLTTTCFLLKH